MSIDKIRAKEIMTRNVVRIHLEMSLQEVLETLSEERISGAPVVDEDGKAVGVISVTDILAYEAGKSPRKVRSAFYSISETEGVLPIEDIEEEGNLQEILNSVPASRAMTPKVVSVRTDANLIHIARLMAKEKIHRVLVLDGGKIAGLISSMDVLKVLGKPARKTAKARR